MPTYSERNPFAFKDETGIICRGYFYTLRSTIDFTGPTIIIDQVNGNVVAPYFSIRSGYKDFTSAYADKIPTDRITEAMKKAGKIIEINNKSLPLKQKWSGPVKINEADGLSLSVLTFPESYILNSSIFFHTVLNCDNVDNSGEITVTAKLESEKDDYKCETTLSHIKLPIFKKELVISKIALLPVPAKPPVYYPANTVDGNPGISYPKQALEEEMKGTVTVNVDVRETGIVNGITILQSSGNEILDSATLRGFTYWKYIPAKTGEVAEKCQLTYQVEYNGTTANAVNITPPPVVVPPPPMPLNTLYAIPGEATLTFFVNYTDITGKISTYRIPAIPVTVE